VVLRLRKGLQNLIKDVVQGEVSYKAILVYDVSRWGRFQDADESAYYEFLCKSAGVRVHYCGEAFANDDSLPAMMMKALRRIMAGEYSSINASGPPLHGFPASANIVIPANGFVAFART